jgi:hypothetical protein
MTGNIRTANSVKHSELSQRKYSLLIEISHLKEQIFVCDPNEETGEMKSVFRMLKKHFQIRT